MSDRFRRIAPVLALALFVCAGTGAAVAGATVASASTVAAAPAVSPDGVHRIPPGITPPTTAGAAPKAPAPNSPELVVLALAPRDRAGLRQLALDATHLDPVTRAARRRAVLPDAARVRDVRTRARALGLTPIAADTSTVTVRGSAALVRRLFGSARAVRPDIASGQSLPALPPSLRGLVTVAAGGDETRPAFHPLNSGTIPGTLSQVDLRSLYGVAATGTAVPDANSPTIATVQFSSWDPADLTAYVRANAIYGGTAYDPVATGAYTRVDVGRGNTDRTDQEEVALDQEAIVTLAPTLRQAAYFAPNNPLGFSQALNQIADESASRRTLALSTSWGDCEPNHYPSFFAGNPDSTLTADEDAVMSATTAGITIFAASGDDGSRDCRGDNGNWVDTPASLPYVTGVGGTSITTGTPSQSWSNTKGSSGGGYSAVYCATAAQAPILPAAGAASDCPTRRARGVPDIALAADPMKGGLSIVSSGCPSNPCAYGGTSLAAPLAAAGFALTIARAGAFAGIGDINPALIAARGTPGLFDVTSGGGNGAYRPTAGWDATTGLGSPNWSVLSGRLVGSSAADSLFAIQETGTASGRVEVSELTHVSGYESFRRRVVTPLGITDPSEWVLFLAPSNGDGKHDLFAIHTVNTGSGKVEVHVLSEASGYQRYIDHVATALEPAPADRWQFALGSFAGDRASDLFGIAYTGTGSGRVEMHVLAEAGNYQTWRLHAATALPVTTPGTWRFLVGDAAGSGDLVGVLRSGGSGHTEVHTLTRASGYRTFSLHIATPLAPFAAATSDFNLTRYDNDLSPDLVLTILDGVGSGKVEEHVLSGASAFQAFSLHSLTALDALSPASWSLQLAR